MQNRSEPRRKRNRAATFAHPASCSLSLENRTRTWHCALRTALAFSLRSASLSLGVVSQPGVCLSVTVTVIVTVTVTVCARTACCTTVLYYILYTVLYCTVLYIPRLSLCVRFVAPTTCTDTDTDRDGDGDTDRPSGDECFRDALSLLRSPFPSALR